MLKFDQISKIFKTDIFSPSFVALDKVSFHIPEGSMMGFLGANGAGKTTSLKIILGFIQANSGQIEFSEKMGNSRNDIFRKIGFLPERPYFYPHLKGEEFIHLLGHLSDLTDVQIKAGIAYWAPRFKIDHAMKRELKTYSKGMLQRVGFLATLIHDPELIILDEPLSGLDPVGRKELKDVMVEIHKRGKTVFFSSHVVSDVEEICDRVIFLKSGKLIYEGSVDKIVRENAKSTFLIKVSSSASVDSLDLLSIKKFSSEITEIEVSAQRKDETIKKLINNNVSILGLEQARMSLEEIFYHIKS